MPLELDINSCQPGFGPHIPDCFTSLEEAQNSLYYHQNRCLQAALDIDSAALHTNPASLLVENAYLESYSQSRDIFRYILRRWSFAFEAFLMEATYRRRSAYPTLICSSTCKEEKGI